jgi:hypothetical protein
VLSDAPHLVVSVLWLERVWCSHRCKVCIRNCSHCTEPRNYSDVPVRERTASYELEQIYGKLGMACSDLYIEVFVAPVARI